MSEFFPNEPEINTYTLLKEPFRFLRPFSGAKGKGGFVELKEIDSDRIWVVKRSEVRVLSEMEVIAYAASGQLDPTCDALPAT